MKCCFSINYNMARHTYAFKCFWKYFQDNFLKWVFIDCTVPTMHPYIKYTIFAGISYLAIKLKRLHIKICSICHTAQNLSEKWWDNFIFCKTLELMKKLMVLMCWTYGLCWDNKHVLIVVYWKVKSHLRYQKVKVFFVIVCCNSVEMISIWVWKLLGSEKSQFYIPKYIIYHAIKYNNIFFFVSGKQNKIYIHS